MKSKTISDNVQVLKNDTYITSVDHLEKKDVLAVLDNQQKLTANKYDKLMNYYLGNHKILNNPDDPFSNENNKIIDNLPSELVDTFNGFFIGKTPNISLANKNDNEELQNWNKSNSWLDKLSEVSKLVDVLGRAYGFLYQNSDGETRATYTDPTESVLIYDDTVESKPVAFIRYWYDTHKQVHAVIYYAQVIEHFDIDKFSDEQETNIYGLVPATEFYANEERQGLYEKELSTIDALDDLLSQKQNNIDYFANAYMYLIGGKINEKDMLKMRKQRLINATSANAVNAKIGFLERPNADGMEEHQYTHLLETIHRNTGIPNMDDEHFAGNSSGVAIKYKLQKMEDKAGTKESKFKYALKNFYRIIFTKNTKITIPSDAWEDIQFYFPRNLPANLADEADTVNKLQGIVSEETLLKVLSIVDDPQQELKLKNKESEQRVKEAMKYTQPDFNKNEDEGGVDE